MSDDATLGWEDMLDRPGGVRALGYVTIPQEALTAEMDDMEPIPAPPAKRFTPDGHEVLPLF